MDLISRQAAIERLVTCVKNRKALVENAKETKDHEYHLGKMGGYWNAMKIIEEQPTIDAVPVVRCKDCKHYQFADNRAFGMPVKRCEWTGFEDVDDNDFCSRGERSEDGET